MDKKILSLHVSEDVETNSKAFCEFCHWEGRPNQVLHETTFEKDIVQSICPRCGYTDRITITEKPILKISIVIENIPTVMGIEMFIEKLKDIFKP